MRNGVSGWLGAAVVAVGFFGAARATEFSGDLIVYGSTPAALTAAIEAKSQGRSVIVVSPESRIGGLTTGGLGATDFGNKSVFGGLALSFYRDVAAYYRDPAEWKKRIDASGFEADDGPTQWNFEPSAALCILEGWEKRHSLDIRRGELLERGKGGVTLVSGRIASIRTLSGNVYRGRVFVDATYEGDLMAAAGVSYAVGREGNDVYLETLNGSQPKEGYHQFWPGVSPYVVPGDPGSGLLPGIEGGALGASGAGDNRVQAYCFRMCLTDDPENRIPFAKPEGYDEREYELLLRNLEAQEKLQSSVKEASRYCPGIPWINSGMPNRKTDTNNRGGFSTDYIGQSARWPEASYEEREAIRLAHLRYQKGLIWTLANHPRVPEPIRREVARWGTCRDEFADGLGDGWQRQLYVREARRMVGEVVMTEYHCRGKSVAAHPVAMAAYQMDSHHVRRAVGEDGFVRNEGDVEVFGGRPYPIDYGAIVPRRGECRNLLVPICLSASHIAFGSIRMEPVYFALGQAAGAAASLAIEEGTDVQAVDYRRLRQRLLAAGQVLSLDPPRFLRVAAANSSVEARLAADFVCTGTNDERVINEAIASLTRGGTVQLLDGDYYVDGFDQENNTAILFGYNDGVARAVTVTGTTENKGYNTHLGAAIHVTQRAMAAMCTNSSYRVFGGTAHKPKAPGDYFTYTRVNNANFRNFFIYFHDASKPLIGIDGRRFGNMSLEQMGVFTERFEDDRYLHRAPATPVPGCIGYWSVPGANDDASRIGYDWADAGGLYAGFVLQGVDHLVMRSCSVSRCCYGYIFRGNASKTLTMLNCADEGNTHLPRFEGKGHLTCIDFNIERFNAAFIPADPDGLLMPQAVETVPGGWHGFLSYTLQGKAFGVRSFWQKGSGTNFKTVDLNADMHGEEKWPPELNPKMKVPETEAG